MDERSAQRAFLQALLQWDYEAMFDKFEKGQGLVDELPKLGRTFASVEVGAAHCPAQPDTMHVHLLQRAAHTSPTTSKFAYMPLLTAA